MKKQFSKKSLIVLISLLLSLATYEIILACAGGEWFDGENSNFAPEAFVSDTTYAPFFYSDMFYYSINYDTDHDTRFNQTNLKEWQAFLSNSVDTATLKFYLDRATLTSVRMTGDWFLSKKRVLPDSLQRYVVRMDRGNTRQKEFIRYLALAKQAEKYALSGKTYYWEYDKRTLPAESELDDLLSQMNNEFLTAKNKFMKERYWFQLVRYYYFYRPEVAVKVFEDNKSLFVPGNMFYRTMAYAAGACYKQKHYAQANYYYSLVFSGNKQLRTVAHWSFRPQEDADWLQTLALCRSNDEKATLWQMLGIFYADEMRSMKEIYRLEPQSEKLDVLLTRFVNRMEGGTPYWYTNADSAKFQLKPGDLQWVRQVADAHKVSNLFLWNVSAGYLCFLGKNYADARLYYDRSAKTLDAKNKLAARQLRMFSLINRIGALNHIGKADEEALLPDLQWLFNDTTKWAALRTSRAVEWIRQILSEKYVHQHEMPKSECYRTGSAFYANMSNVEQYRNFLEKKNDSPYDSFCKKIASVKIQDVYEFLAVKETFHDNDLPKALRLFERVEPVQLGANPFNGRMTDCHDCDQAAPQKVKYTQSSLAKKLLEMETAINSGNDLYNNALLLGNAFYNISFYGNARSFYECKILGESMSDPGSIDFHFRPMLTDNAVAHRYYEMAFNAAQTDEQRAKCLFMMSKCERNTWYNTVFYNYSDNAYHFDYDRKIDFVEWDSFKKMNQFQNTQYYKMAIKECGYFRKVAQR